MARRRLSILFIAYGILLTSTQEATGYTYKYKPPTAAIENPTASLVYQTGSQIPSAHSYSAPVPTDHHLNEEENECSRAMENYKKMRNAIGYRALEASHYMIPDKALIDLAHEMNYEYSETLSKHSKPARTGKSDADFAINVADPALPKVQNVHKRFGPHQPTHSNIKVDYACTDDHLSWTEINPYSGKVLKYERRYDDDKKTMEYRMLSDDQLLNYVFGNKNLENHPARRTDIRRQGFALITFGTVIAGIFAVPILMGIGAILTILVTAAAVVPITAISLIVSKFADPCSGSASYAPCTCGVETNNLGLMTLGISCPSGTTIAQIQTAFAKIPMGKKIGKVVLNLPSGANAIPVNLLGQRAVESIQLIGAGNTNALTINQGAFLASALTLTNLIIQNFDVINVDYSFLNNFNSLSSVQINQCSNAPSAAILPKNLSQTLPKLSNFLVDNVNIYPNCPYPGILLPCSCAIPVGQTIGTVTCPISSVSQIQNAFSLIPQKTNIGPFVFNFEPNTVTSIPAFFLSNIPGTSITLIGPDTTIKSRLQINTAAFKASALTAKTLTIQNFDVGQLNYAFVNGFNALTTIDINTCTGAPASNPASLPTNLPALTAINVDGSNIYTKPANR